MAPDPDDSKEIVTMCKLSEDGSECEQASIAWSRNNPNVVEQFGGYSGYKVGNCIRKGYPEAFRLEKHKIPFLGEITTRHFRKPAQVQYKGTIDKDALNLPASFDSISIRTMAFVGLGACLGFALTVIGVRYHTSGKDPQMIHEALIDN